MMVGMLAVMLDTNAIHRDPWLTSDAGKKLLRLAEDGACLIVYPQVVLDELRRQRIEAAEAAHDQAAKGIDDMAKAGVDVSQTAADLRSNLEQITSDLDDAFSQVLARSNVTAAPVPKVAVEEVLRRDLERRRPFMEIESHQKKKSVGFRDVLIWETLLEVLACDPPYPLTLFVSSDKGFLSDDSKELHPDLLHDLDSQRVDHDRVVTVKSVPQAISEVEASVEAAARDAAAARVTAPGPAGSTEGAARESAEFPAGGGTVARVSRAELVTAATEALYALANKDVSMQMVYGGDYDYPDFVKFTMPTIESGFLSYIDQTTEFEFDESPITPDVLVATAEAVITIEGAVHKGDWFMDDSDSVDIMGELNDRYFETSSEVEVRVVVELAIEGGQIDVVDIVLEDPPSPTNDTNDVLALELPEGPADVAMESAPNTDVEKR